MTLPHFRSAANASNSQSEEDEVSAVVRRHKLQLQSDLQKMAAASAAATASTGSTSSTTGSTANGGGDCRPEPKCEVECAKKFLHEMIRNHRY